MNIPVWVSHDVRSLEWLREVRVRSDTICAQRDTRSRAKLREVQHRLCYAVLGNYKFGRAGQEGRCSKERRTGCQADRGKPDERGAGL